MAVFMLLILLMLSSICFAFFIWSDLFRFGPTVFINYLSFDSIILKLIGAVFGFEPYGSEINFDSVNLNPILIFLKLSSFLDEKSMFESFLIYFLLCCFFLWIFKKCVTGFLTENFVEIHPRLVAQFLQVSGCIVYFMMNYNNMQS